MSIINTQYNHVGVQNLVNQFANYAAAGAGSMLSHTDGYVYCVFARNYLNGIDGERRLYVTRSNDGGVTWSTEVQISSGYWDDDPALIQLAGASDHTGSNPILANDLGVVFNRTNAISTLLNTDTNAVTRFTFNKEICSGAPGYFSSYDAVNADATQKKWISVVRTLAGFLICCLPATSINTRLIDEYQNTGLFTENTWTVATPSTNIFPANQQPMSLSVKTLINSDLALVAAYRTALSGSTTAASNLPGATMRCDMGIAFSTDGGATWSAIQNLTSYPGTPAFDLATGILSVASADLQQTSDGMITVAYQEQTAPQYMGDGSPYPFSLPGYPSCGQTTNPIYYTASNGHSELFIGASDGNQYGNGGVFMFDITGNTQILLNTGSTPTPLWGNDVQNIAISPDGTRLAVASASSGISIINITNPSPASWVPIRDLRTGTTFTGSPTITIAINNIGRVQWDGNDTIYFSYHASSLASNVWGGRYDISTDTHTLMKSAASSPIVYDFVIQPSKLVILNSTGAIESVNKSGVSGGDALTLTNTSFFNMVYDTVNLEYLCLSFTSMSRVTDSGSFVEQQVFTPTSNPSWGGLNNHNVFITIPGKGIFVEDGDAREHQYMWYSFASRQPSGVRARDEYLGLGENVASNWCSWGTVLNSNWMAIPSVNELTAVNLSNVGRIRYGIYDPNTNTMITDFYDVCNPAKLGTNLQSLQFPKFCADPSDALYWYFSRFNINNPGGNELAPVLGVTQPDVHLITAKADIRNTVTRTIQAVSKIRNTYTNTVWAKTRIAFAQCIKAKARIVPVENKTISAMCRIQNWKIVSCPINFSISRTSQISLNLTFSTATGYNTVRSISALANIRAMYSYRMTGHFIVTSAPATQTFTVLSRTTKTVSARARILF